MASLDRTEVMASKVTREEARAIREAAAEEGWTVSEYMRAATFAYMALSGRSFAMKMVGRGALRLGAEVGGWVLEKVRELGRRETSR